MCIWARIKPTYIYFLIIFPISGCKPGYYKFNCNHTCQLPHFVYGCQSTCDCPDDECDFANGCPSR